ncbi:L,D-transpeptidase family protein [Daejeonella sp. JGW-45]|uniref:L,D-transpeptidase family protein n=1 Tax=Daejeonella sp. JGW-45 TaxID=3034148 RepID=UPI0023ECB01A|nr:L,D-transpeptidase family protein [Daejeonella sp. JGW-45]
MKNYLILLLLTTLSRVFPAYSQEPKERQQKALQAAIEEYQKLNDRNNWPEINLNDKPVIRLNDRSSSLPAIKERLKLLGDLRRVRDDDVYTDRLEDAIKQFQLRHGLEDDGIIGPAFMKALNIPLGKRITQMSANLDRIMMDTVEMNGTRIIANIPNYKLYVYEKNTQVLSMDIVVGKISNPTVVFSDTLENIVFSPYWNVPASIVRNEILPAISKNSSYLQKNNMEITGKVDGLPVIRQKPGPDNSLGLVKFLFPNQYNIYFHDTPAKGLFDKKNRAFSHGCIRLSQPFELAQYLLKDQPGWDESEIRAAMNAGTEKWVRLLNKIPVSIIYYTAWVDSSGLVNFRDDIYGHDEM